MTSHPCRAYNLRPFLQCRVLFQPLPHLCAPLRSPLSILDFLEAWDHYPARMQQITPLPRKL